MMEIMINNVMFLFSATNEDFYQSALLFILKILLVVKVMRCHAITSRRDVTTTKNGKWVTRTGNGKIKNGTKPSFNPSPISISSFPILFFVPNFFIFLFSVLVFRSPCPVLVTSLANGQARKF